MKTRGTIALAVCVTVIIALSLIQDQGPDAENSDQKNTTDDSLDPRLDATKDPEPEDPIHSEVIAKAEAAGLSDEQLQNVQSNVGGIGLLARILSQPIEFYGRVVDLDGNPVAHAQVTYSAFNRFFENSPTQTTRSNEDGYFAINDIQGGSIYIRVAKDGYYKIEESERRFENPFADDPNNPAILKLRKHGEAQPLVKVGEKWGGPIWAIPRDGSPVGFDLIRASRVSLGDGHIVVRAWSPDTKLTVRQGKEPYAWKFEISAPGGGFIERTDQFDFIAPEYGYTETLTFEMSTDNEDWNDYGIEEEVFAKLKDGNYARLLFRYKPSGSKRGDSFKIYSYTNPSGSRNLEYDPKLEVPSE